MSSLKKYWKVLVALLILIVAFLLFYTKYLPEKQAYESEKSKLNTTISALRVKIAQNQKYTEYQEKIPGELEKINESRKELYSLFPAELREEDQIMYVLYLEEIFGTEIFFNFGTVSSIQVLQDGGVINGLTLTINYQTSYEGFKDMINYIATDSRITSVQFATMDYDAANDIAYGYLTLLCYTIDSDLVQYQKPDLDEPNVGKDNIFD